MLLGRSKCATKRTSGLSIPMPNAIVATITMPSSLWKRDWLRARAPASMPAWYGSARTPFSPSQSSGLFDLAP